MDDLKPVRPAEVYLEEFDATIAIVRAEGRGDFFSVRAISQAMGMHSGRQADKLENDERYEGFLDTFTVPTNGGPQPALCIHRSKVTMWLASIAPKRIMNLKVRGKVEQFQQALWDAADALWWGVATVAPGREVAKPAEGALRMSCLRCGTPHRLMVSQHTAMWEIDR